jgi:hypothetical protein
MVQGKQGKAHRYIIKLSGLVIIATACFIATFSFAEENKYQPAGPLNIRNQMPMYIFYMSMVPEKAQTLKKGKFGFEAGYHVSNTIIRQNDSWPSWKPYSDLIYYATIDCEVNRIYADIRYGILDNLELAIDIPYFIYSGGYLDTFIHDFEKTFKGITTPSAREDRPKNKYEVLLDHYGQSIINDTSKPDGLGEIILEAKYRVCEESGSLPTLSLRTALKLPTATDTSSRLLGSDKVDFGIGVLADKRLLERLYLFANFNVAFIQRPDLLEKLKVDDYMLSGMLALEYFITNRTSLMLQGTANSSVYEPGINSMEKAACVLTLGFNHNFTDKVSWQVAMEENVDSASPDFGLFTSFKINI